MKLKDFLLGICAGCAIAIGGILNILSKTFIPDPYGKIVGSILFPIGLTMVCFLGFNLFTGKIGFLLDKKEKYPLFLINIYLGNIVGSLIVGFIAYFALRNVESIYQTATAITAGKTASLNTFLGGFGLLWGAILCGVLVYTACFFFKNMKKTYLKVLGIFLPIALFVYFGYDHCVANMFYFTFGFNFANWQSYVNIALATLGNSLGAIILHEMMKIFKNI